MCGVWMWLPLRLRRMPAGTTDRHGDRSLSKITHRWDRVDPAEAPAESGVRRFAPPSSSVRNVPDDDLTIVRHFPNAAL